MDLAKIVEKFEVDWKYELIIADMDLTLHQLYHGIVEKALQEHKLIPFIIGGDGAYVLDDGWRIRIR